MPKSRGRQARYQFLSKLLSCFLKPSGMNGRWRDLNKLSFIYDIQHCYICRPSDSTVSKDAGIEPRTVATEALALTTRLDLSHMDETLTNCNRYKILQLKWHLLGRRGAQKKMCIRTKNARFKRQTYKFTRLPALLNCMDPVGILLFVCCVCENSIYVTPAPSLSLQGMKPEVRQS